MSEEAVAPCGAALEILVAETFSSSDAVSTALSMRLPEEAEEEEEATPAVMGPIPHAEGSEKILKHRAQRGCFVASS